MVIALLLMGMALAVEGEAADLAWTIARMEPHRALLHDVKARGRPVGGPGRSVSARYSWLAPSLCIEDLLVPPAGDPRSAVSWAASEQRDGSEEAVRYLRSDWIALEGSAVLWEGLDWFHDRGSSTGQFGHAQTDIGRDVLIAHDGEATSTIYTEGSFAEDACVCNAFTNCGNIRTGMLAAADLSTLPIFRVLVELEREGDSLVAEVYAITNAAPLQGFLGEAHRRGAAHASRRHVEVHWQPDGCTSLMLSGLEELALELVFLDG